VVATANRIPTVEASWLDSPYIHQPVTGVGIPNALLGAGNIVLVIQRMFMNLLFYRKSITNIDGLVKSLFSPHVT